MPLKRELQEWLDEAKEEIEALKKENEELKTKVEDGGSGGSADTKELDTKIKKLEKEAKASDKKIKKLEKDLKEKDEQIEKLEADKELLQGQLDETDELLLELEDQVKDLKSDVKDAKEETKEAKKKSSGKKRATAPKKPPKGEINQEALDHLMRTNVLASTVYNRLRPLKSLKYRLLSFQMGISKERCFDALKLLEETGAVVFSDNDTTVTIVEPKN